MGKQKVRKPVENDNGCEDSIPLSPFKFEERREAVPKEREENHPLHNPQMIVVKIPSEDKMRKDGDKNPFTDITYCYENPNKGSSYIEGVYRAGVLCPLF